MKNTLKLDGTRVILRPMDLDGDGKIGEDEDLHRNRDSGVAEIKESTELKDALGEFNKDEKNYEGLSSIDFMGSIENIFEMPPLIALDSSVGLRVIPSRSAIIGRILMRKNVSYKQQGRKQFVDLVVGKKQADQMSATQKVTNFSGMGSNG